MATAPPAVDSDASAEAGPIRRAGVVGLIGRTNVGKSTLLNRLLGEKLAIITPRPQTTRSRLLGVKRFGEAQLALVDSPGLHRAEGPGRTQLNRYMQKEALAVLAEVDVVLLITDIRQLLRQSSDDPPPAELPPGDRYVADHLLAAGKPAVLAINKIDLLRDRRLLLPLMEAWDKTLRPAAIVPISAAYGDGLERLVAELIPLLPEGPALFPEDMLTDRAERWLAAELVREQVFLATRQEVPYAAAVTVDDWQERTVGGRRVGVTIHATIHVEKPAQKKIVVGEGGRMVRHIGTRARAEIAKLLGCPVHLELFVRVDPRWSRTQAGLREMGYGGR
ncbi:MAG: GTPase Era [Myxococcales bacterium]|nr:GTPase Era [Myxococcota bacterium]MDW8283626.1 GTPase Era [Myxococcales bacterium]